ncbi:DNA starvation/stationary phase protection protein Dps [Halosimplex amylolyticum]|uniref:DNA starvation/stationary phase protection protein Dps n=1 Tax=Halosimplex amylolyticum TaxID=3396616 RepID=UPI003F55E8B8
MSQTYESTPSQQSSGRQNESQQPATGGQGQSRTPTAPVGQLFPTRSYLPQDVRTTSISVLNQCLADLTAVNMQLKSAHWNVKGQEFYQLHELFEDLTEEFEAFIDEVAERSSALGGRPPGTAREVAQNTTIPALPRQTTEGMALVAELADRLAILDANLYGQLETVTQQNDLDTADLLNEISRAVAKSLWFLEAHLQGAPAATGGQPGGQSSGLSMNTTGLQYSPDSQLPQQ